MITYRFKNPVLMWLGKKKTYYIFAYQVHFYWVFKFESGEFIKKGKMNCSPDQFKCKEKRFVAPIRAPKEIKEAYKRWTKKHKKLARAG